MTSRKLWDGWLVRARGEDILAEAVGRVLERDLGAWMEERNKKIMDGDDDGNTTDEAVGTH